MFQVDFTPRRDDASWSEKWAPPGPSGHVGDLRELDVNDFCLRYFQVDLRLVVGDVDMSITSPGLPVIDLVLMFEFALRCINREEICDTETSISQHDFRFWKEGDLVHIARSSAGLHAQLSVSEFNDLVAKAKSLAVDLLVRSHRELRNNIFLVQLLAS